MHNNTLNQSLIQSFMQSPFSPAHTITVNKISISLMMQTLSCENTCLLSWLEQQPMHPKFYLETHTHCFAAVGCAYAFHSIPVITKNSLSVKLFGGQQFFANQQPKSTGIWASFPSCYYFLPILMIEYSKDLKSSTIFLYRTSRSQLTPLSHQKPFIYKEHSKLKHNPKQPQWNASITKALDHINQNIYKKIVLARHSTLTTQTQINPYQILSQLQGKYRFAFQLTNTHTFIGNSPELLYQRTHNKIYTMSLAGTSPRYKDKIKDDRSINYLLNSSKLLQEVSIVKHAITEALSKIAHSISVSKCHIVSTSSLHHLCHTITAHLNTSDINDQKILNALHPTPAVGGYPQQQAMDYLNQLEHINRGWYASPLGYISHNTSTHIVALRSALVTSNTINMFAGAGIVKGSTPSDEWQELDHKISQYEGLFL